MLASLEPANQSEMDGLWAKADEERIDAFEAGELKAIEDAEAHDIIEKRFRNL